MDTEVGRLLDQLDLNGLADDTIVVLLSDHGENMGAHLMIEKDHSMYEELIGIPFVMGFPGHIDAGRTSDALFSTVDLVATVGDLRDVCVNDGVGMNFGDVLVSGDPGPRDAILSEFYSHFADQHQFVKTVRADRWKVNLFLLDGSELYDLQDDPYEMTNLIGSESLAATRAELLD